jgi:hypothetical protein
MKGSVEYEHVDLLIRDKVRCSDDGGNDSGKKSEKSGYFEGQEQ